MSFELVKYIALNKKSPNESGLPPNIPTLSTYFECHKATQASTTTTTKNLNLKFFIFGKFCKIFV